MPPSIKYYRVCKKKVYMDSQGCEKVLSNCSEIRSDSHETYGNILFILTIKYPYHKIISDFLFSGGQIID